MIADDIEFYGHFCGYMSVPGANGHWSEMPMTSVIAVLAVTWLFGQRLTDVLPPVVRTFNLTRLFCPRETILPEYSNRCT